ncbi:MAG: DNA cytosine methyltransferase [Proteobacteria bacterium]|nr:DNA cytosine methyltransferase [Pseudomonadota bacterium]MBU2261983.1 DNA cytosine methyltransferase [Pseudomonadota bacterium]
MNNSVVPVIDMFAGPGGLGEGFARFSEGLPSGPPFDVRLSIEKDFHACQTLELRAFLREFLKGKTPEEYYDYVRSPSPSKRNNLMKEFPEGQRAIKRVWHAELGGESFPDDKVNKRIKESLGESKTWVLIGGPPCQAYSLAGRSRRSKQPREEFENLREHYLYNHYLKIIRNHQPTVFIMENVKGILTSKISKSYIFTRICDDLESAGYLLYLLVQWRKRKPLE